MESIIQYSLHFSLAITLFYGLYLLVLKNETFYNVNRLYLVSGLLLAILLPLFPITYTTPISLINNADFFSLSNEQLSDNASIVNGEVAVNSWTFIEVVITIYFLGAMLFLVRLLWQTFKIFQKIKNSNYEMIEGIKVIDQPDIMPYSFFNVVFIDIQKYSERELSNILAHEKVHIQERHWIDLLIIELLSVLFWINPVVWLYERSIKQNHEYLADQGVLLAGYHPGQYQALLINQLMGVKVLGFAHNLNFSLNKKRMKMMKKEKSPGASKMKLLLALPIIALLVFAFAKKEYVMVAPENTTSNTALNYNQGETQKGIVKVKGKVFNSEGVPLTGANVILKGTNNGTVVDRQGEFVLDVPKNDKSFKRSTKDGGEVTVDNAQALVISFVGYGTHEYVFDTQSNHEPIEVKIKLHKATFNITLPEIGDNEELIKGAVVEVPSPEFDDEVITNNGEIVEVPPPPKGNKKKEIFTIVEEMPNYKNGGMYQLAADIKGLTASISKNTSDRGEVIVGFTVAADGSVVNPQVVKSSDSRMLDGSAIKIVQKLDHWSPGVQRGKKVPVDLTLPVRFE